MKTKKEILEKHGYHDGLSLHSNPKLIKKELYAAMEEYAKEYAKEYYNKHAPKITEDHCICTGDQYGWATNPKCLIHGDKK